VVVHIHPRIDRYRQFRIQSENLKALEKATVIELDAFLVPEVNGQPRSRNRLGADESRPAVMETSLTCAKALDTRTKTGTTGTASRLADISPGGAGRADMAMLDARIV
jgi:hypothetical protein